MEAVMVLGWLMAAVVLLAVAGVSWFAGAVSTSLRWQRRMELEQRGWVAKWQAERAKHDGLLFAGWRAGRGVHQAEKAA